MIFLMLALVPNLRYIVRDKSDFYSDYRNKIDISYQDFNLRYWTYRIAWAIAAVILTGALIWSLI